MKRPPIGLLALGLGACTFGTSSVGDVPDSVGDADGTSTGDEPMTSDAMGDGATVDPDDGTSSEPGTDDVGDDDDDDDDDHVPQFEACPDPWPSEWLFCEDFEGMASVPDLQNVFAVVDVAEGRLGPSDGVGHSGTRSLRVGYDGVNQWNGLVGVLFGPLPFDWTGPAYAPDVDADEIWIRFHTRGDETWPGMPLGQSMRIASLRNADWTPPAQLNLLTVGENLGPTAQAMTCSGCTGFDDWGNYTQVSVATASTPGLRRGHGDAVALRRAASSSQHPRHGRRRDRHLDRWRARWLGGGVQLARLLRPRLELRRPASLVAQPGYPHRRRPVLRRPDRLHRTDRRLRAILRATSAGHAAPRRLVWPVVDPRGGRGVCRNDLWDAPAAKSQAPAVVEPYRPEHHVRIVTAASLFDGHDAAINVMRRILQSSGAEVIHLGHNRSVAEIVDCAIQEDAQGVAITSYQGGHVEYFKYMHDLLKEAGAATKIFGGGGGTILPSELEELHDYGIARLYSPDDGRSLGLQGMINDVLRQCDFATTAPEPGKDRRAGQQGSSGPRAVDLDGGKNRPQEYAELAERLPSIEGVTIPVLGITGTGGSGKSSLVDELVRRFLADFPDKRIAVISVDPSKRRTGGALLGDRIRMNAIHNPRVYMRSLATRQSNLALSKYVRESIDICKAARFDLVIVETSGIGQSDTEITEHSDVSLYVMTAEYGAATQLEKIDMLDFADVIAINKFDKRGSLDALRDVRKQYKRNHMKFEVADEELPVSTGRSRRSSTIRGPMRCTAG